MTNAELQRIRELCEQATPGRTIDMTGLVVGLLTVIGRSPVRKKNGQARWSCLCECGNETDVTGGNLRTGHVRSCGCLRGISNRAHKTKHGHSRRGSHTAEYNAWKGILARCLNEKNKHFAEYGGRGIRVCERWRESFKTFLADVGKRPHDELSIDRIDVNGDYEPGNVRWATWSQQRLNQRRVRATASSLRKAGES